MKLNEQTTKILGIVVAVVFVIVVAAWMILNPAPEHIEDTNGPDNYALQQITEADVVGHKMGSRGGLSTSETSWDFGFFSVSNGMKYSCRKFTGVQRLHACTIFKGSDIHVYLANFKVRSGNFAFYVVLDDQIVGELVPDEFGTAEFILEDLDKTGSLEYIIAGESADFVFTAPVDW